MEKNELKKLIYKEKLLPAKLINIKKDRLLYRSDFSRDDHDYIITFSVPLSDIQDAIFYPIMEAKLLIRWLQIGENPT